MRTALACTATVWLGLCLASCGGATAPPATTTRASAPTDATGRPDATQATVATGVRARGDYDADEYQGGSDADNDDTPGPKDRDNDTDNKSGSLYDADDAPVLHYGRPADAADRREVAALVQSYYRAASELKGAAACSMLTSAFVAGTPETLGRPPGPPYYSGRTCGQVMTKVFALNINQLRDYVPQLRVIALRRKGSEAIAVLGFQSLPVRFVRVKREHGAWKLNARLDDEMP